jgi:hypothetical protein
MKKTFQLKAENKADERQVDSIKHEIKKYIARERRKKLPEDVDFWDFDCSIGENEQETTPIHITKINSKISELSQEKKESFYLEILAIPGHRAKK